MCIADPQSKWKTVYFTPVCCFVVYNSFDVVGKYAATLAQWPGPSTRGQWTLILMSVVRIGMIHLFLYCNVAPNNRTLPVRLAPISPNWSLDSNFPSR